MKQNISLEQIEMLNYNDQKLLVKEIGIYDCEQMTVGKLIEFIRKYYQMDVYTVDNSWHIQLFEPEIAPNMDEVSCIYEEGYGKNELVDVLFTCVVWILVQIRDNN